MKRRLNPTEAFGLYLVVFGFFLGLFVLGLLMGSGLLDFSQLAEGVTQGTSPTGGTADPVKEYTFYDDLEPSDAPTELSHPSDRHDSEPEIVVLDGLDSQGPPGGAEPPAVGLTGDYTIQVAALGSQQEAEQFVVRLSAADFVGRISAPGSGPRGRYYRVWVGRFRSIEEARPMEKRLKAAGFPTYIRRLE